MSITAEMMMEQIKRLTSQRDQALATYHQTVGAISLAEHVLSQIQSPGEEPTITLDEMAAAMGADSAEVINLNKASA